ncbi:hypothetical protein IBX73_02170 [candidate division WOR-3 bacterium]|nr:hypothetical protein [candidate division WOR-3 bacterium]
MSRGISGFGVIILIIILLVVGYAGYQIAGVHFKYGSLNEKVETTVRIGPLQNDDMIREELSKVAGEMKIVLTPENIWIDRSIPDSFRIYIEYTDSSNIFGVFTYNRKFVVDQAAPIQINY